MVYYSNLLGMINSHCLVHDVHDKTLQPNTVHRCAYGVKKMGSIFRFCTFIYKHGMPNLVRNFHHRRSPFVKFICPVRQSPVERKINRIKKNRHLYTSWWLNRCSYLFSASPWISWLHFFKGVKIRDKLEMSCHKAWQVCCGHIKINLMRKKKECIITEGRKNNNTP